MSWKLKNKPNKKKLVHNQQSSYNDDLIRLYRNETDDEKKAKYLETLVLANQALIIKFAEYYHKQYQNYNIPFDYIVSEGNLAMLIALEKYILPEFQDSDIPAAFSTYCTYYIRKTMSTFCKNFYRNHTLFSSSHDIHAYESTIEDKNSKEPLDILEDDRLLENIATLSDPYNLLRLVSKLTTNEELCIFAVYNGLYGQIGIMNTTIHKTSEILNMPPKHVSSVISRVMRLLKNAVETSVIKEKKK